MSGRKGSLNMIKTDIGLVKEQPPWFSHEAHCRYGMVHLLVAPRCNIQCGYCVRSINLLEERPGVTERILSSPEALKIYG